MKFKNEFKKQMVLEWADAYLDYNGLKRLLLEISYEKQIQKSRASSGYSKKKPAVDRKCSEFISQPRKSHVGKDIENQNQDIEKSQQHDFRKSQEISEIEVKFFKKLDEELNKLNSFYKESVEAVTNEASVLTKQMETLIALRRKIQKESICIPQLDQAHKEVSSSKHLEEITKENSQNSQEILKHVKVLDDSGTDNDDRSKIEEQLKKAFAEFYQELYSLKQFSFMNLSAFARILRKYEKISSSAAGRSYMEIVDNSYLGTSDEVADLMKMVEITFIKNFSNSNYKEGIKLLKPKTKREKPIVTFSSGFLFGCTVALLAASVLKILSQRLLEKEDGTHYMENIFPLYSLFGFIVLHVLMYAADLHFWRCCGVNYPFIFGSKRGTKFGCQQVFLLGAGLAVLASASFLASLYVDRDPSTRKYRTEAEKVPLGTAAVRSLKHCAEFLFIQHSLSVKFPDYFLADQLTSQVQASRCIVLYICYYGLGEHSRKQNKCHTHGVYNTLSFVIAVIPFWLRFLQCVRRLLEEKEAMHGYNALKYLSTIVAVLIRTACELRKGVSWMVLALISSAVSMLINTYWDIVVDWGLLRKHSKNKYLRDRLLVSNKRVYFAAIIVNVVLRVAWIQLVLAFNLRSFQKLAAVTSISCLEIVRRGLWNFFSLENEHLNNVNKYRSFKSVPLPFSYSDDENDKDD
ncbi:phosphate transporter PHO1 homolog 10-like isoform X2 [Cucurbita maxima]|uniref:Phosphate transporter PHO1 homolog 10-like isoform X2 n=1 Tax=Cucurbita maxima TaxID=3661 RepID=A0A6J1HTT3_CUCMA|nr:phosphate transporter PHO1 homolog 10-like isoform X2 [Cucurbita maxima]